ncbi:PepSY-like domain-containing protein [Olivibacter domesticus]|uniref:Putative beta-lactamase-inhibitor-like, PepSY-like n=1 Tax=Olivibacter domesticus TaxID=407022 RepID=A0A1H7R1W1_OLID1|nr:PepSY-like domain-containing protein [Olivibacter domesticus]SEL54261.1 Putative beta-lactamase-inhibitor-like, PepSY-like [Olivibacter domesticus]
MKMKKSILIGFLALLINANVSLGQDIQSSQVPSVVINNFHKAFPNASDVEWEQQGDLYKVEFETGLLSTDHDAWYDQAGKLTEHKEDLSKRDLPQKVLTKIRANFNSYRIDDVKKITKGNSIGYTLELKSFTEELKVAFDANGNVLSQVLD